MSIIRLSIAMTWVSGFWLAWWYGTPAEQGLAYLLTAVLGILVEQQREDKEPKP